MKMDLRNPQNGEIININFPVNYATMQSICERLDLDNTAQTEVHISTMFPKGLREPLDDKIVNINELNFLANKINSLSYDKSQNFMVVANGMENPTLTELINLAHNIDCYSVLRDYSDLSGFNAEHLDKLGIEFYTEQFGSRPDYTFSGDAWLDELREIQEPISNEFGLAFRNTDDYNDFYDGKHFPFQKVNYTDICVKIVGEKYDEFIHLPATIPEINKALSRMGDDIIQQYEVHHYYGRGSNEPIVTLDELNCNELFDFSEKYLKLRSYQDGENLGNIAQILNFQSFDQLNIVMDEIKKIDACTYTKNYTEFGKNYVMEQCDIESDIDVMSYIDFEKLGKDLLKDKTHIFTNTNCIVYYGKNEDMLEILENYEQEQNGEMEICN